MKRIVFIIFFLACIFVVFTCASANSLLIDRWSQNLGFSTYNQDVELEVPEMAIFGLPSGLITIEAEAFEGTSIRTVVLPESIRTIGEYAFSNIETLKQITIPNGIKYMSQNAFRGSNNVKITGAPMGYARSYAQENGIPFNPITSFYAYNTTVQIMGLSKGKTERQRLFLDDETAEENKRRIPTGRMIGELKADRCETINAFHIQGRSPPMG